MFSRNHFSELTDSLQSGFFADRAVLTLARAKKSARLEKNDLTVVDDILQFLKNALEGSEWTEKPKFTTDSVEFAEAFSKASRALPDAKTSESFRKYIEDLIDSTERLKTSAHVNEDDIKPLMEFFTRYGQRELERTDDLINPKGEMRLGSWMSAKALSGS